METILTPIVQKLMDRGRELRGAKLPPPVFRGSPLRLT